MLVQLTLKTMHDMLHVGKACRLQRITSRQRALARPTQQQQRLVFARRFPGHHFCKLVCIRLQVRIFVPGHIHNAGWPAHVQRLNFHTYINKQRVGVCLQPSVGFFGL